MKVLFTREIDSLNVPDSNIWHHIAPLKYMDSIMSKGILPGYKKGLTNARPKWPHVYLTKKPERILASDAGICWCIKHKPVVFKIDVTGLVLSNDHYVSQHKENKKEIEKTYFDIEAVTESIHPSRILEVKNYWDYIYFEQTPEFEKTKNIEW